MEFPKKYQPSEFEGKIYDMWEKGNFFKPKKGDTGKTFYIPIPPPNVTGNLHLGHAMTLTIEDIMTRYHRMKGDETLWVPGTDHAGISTQAVVEKKLAKEGIKRTDIGREKFLEEMWKWKNEYEKNITDQTKKMGSSCDWSKSRFTLDEGLNKIVEYTFCDLYNKGLIYRGEYMVNYSPALASVISDIEVDFREENAKLYYITYFISGTNNELIIATTRPETLLADQAVAVHPKDRRFRKMIGRKVILPIVNKEIPIIGDEIVDREFGTGALKITPAHDATDFEVGKRHGLRLDYKILDKNGMMTKEAGIFAGQDTITARENIVELLKSKGNLVKIEPYTHKVGYCERSGCKIETLVSTQWFVKSSELAIKVIDGYKKGEFKIIPERFNKIFENWIYNLHDWCISRQLWWGHQIPAYYDKKTGELLGVTIDSEEVYKKYGKENVRRDEDVLDTWYSSALWPFSILDWSQKKPGELFKKFYNANILETGYDILPFWVIKMLLMGYEYTGKTPFKNIYLHGLVLDEKGKKMSKSLGNGINPLDVIKDYSADALRLTLVIGNTPGNNMNFSMKNVENNSLFLNKLWNATRFVHANIGEITKSYNELKKSITLKYDKLMDHEKWILSRLKETIDRSTLGMEKFNFGETGFDLIRFTKDEFADFYIEEYKITKNESKYGQDVISFVILSILKFWHPYIPFITEELYRNLTNNKSLIDSDWPSLNIKKNAIIEKNIGTVYDVIRTIRNIRAEKGIKPGCLVDAILILTKSMKVTIEHNKAIICGLAKLNNLEITEKNKVVDEKIYSYGVVKNIDIYVDTSVSSNIEEEVLRLKQEIDDKKEYIKIIDLKLLNKDFIKNAPENIVRSEQEKKTQAQEQLKKLIAKYNALTMDKNN